MKHHIYWTLLLVIMVFPLSLHGQTDRQTLQSAGPVAIVVELVGRDWQTAGLTNAGIKVAIERRLRPTVVIDDAAKSQLYVNVNEIGSNVGAYAVCVSVEFQQQVWILQNRQTIIAPTWSRDSVGIRSVDRLAAVLDLVLSYVDELKSDYAEANRRN